MRSKRIAALALAVLMTLGLAACGAKKEDSKTESADMVIRPVELSEEETALTELLGLEMGDYHLYEFQLGEESGVQSVRLAVYELAGGEWAEISTHFRPVSDATGRIALTYGKITDGVTITVQSESGTGSSSYTPTPEDDVSGMACATSMLTSAAGIEPEGEIPLAIQIVTAKGQITSYEVQYFGMPREYVKHDYEHVYAITVLFSQKSVDELVQTMAPGIPQNPAGEPSAEPSPET